MRSISVVIGKPSALREMPDLANRLQHRQPRACRFHMPQHLETSIDEPRMQDEFVFGLCSFDPKEARRILREKQRGKISTFGFPPAMNDVRNERHPVNQQNLTQGRIKPVDAVGPDTTTAVLFASHGSYGVADLGASKTVIGSQLVGELIRHLHPSIQSQLYRCPCHVNFRFGNQATLSSQEALVIPLSSQLHLKVAVVPGATPFLLSNALLRTLQAVVDTGKNVMWVERFKRQVPLHLTDRGLYLIDINDLCIHKSRTAECNNSSVPEQQIHRESPMQKCIPKVSQPSVSTTCFNEEATSIPFKNSQSDSCPSDRVQSSHHDVSEGNSDQVQSLTSPERSQLRDGSDTSFGPRSVQDGARPSQLVQDDHRGLAGPHDRLWNKAQRPIVSEGVDRRPGVGEVHVQSLSQEPESLTQAISALCGAHDRATGGHGTSDSSDGSIVINTDAQRCDGGISSGQGIDQAKAEAHGSGKEDPHGRDGSRESGLGGRLERGRDDRELQPSSCQSHGRHPDPPGKDAQHGECFAADHPAHHRDQGEAMMSSEWHQLHAGDIDAEVMMQSTENTRFKHSDKESFKFWSLVKQIESELQACVSSIPSKERSCDLFEVFCGPQSQLTSQAIALGMRAYRFGYDQADLSTREGRQVLFEQLVMHSPRHLWFAPECGPWSAWSQFNGSLSLHAFDEIHAKRVNNLYQLALGLVLFRHQFRSGKHLHWEQPQRSLMFKTPLLQQVMAHAWCAVFDMCEVGQLQDPVNHLLMKKGMQVITTSERMFRLLHGRQCSRNHDHQQIEGSTVYEGKTVSRTSFSENYPRKFARQVVKVIQQIFPKERPMAWDVLVEAPSNDDKPIDRLAKRVRAQARLKHRVPPAPVPVAKRRKLGTKQNDPSVIETDQWKMVFNDVEKITKRVGKTEDQSDSIIQKLQELMPEKKIQCAISCRGTDRTIGPPTKIVPGEAPYRKMVFIHRQNGTIMSDPDWEYWQDLAQRQLVRPGHPVRLGITVFACNPVKEIQPRPAVSDPMNPLRTPSEEALPNPPIQPDVESPESELAKCDNQSVQHGPRFLQLSKEEQSLVLKVHRNMGHPTPDRLSWLLKQQGFRPDVFQSPYDLRCSACESLKVPKVSRPSHIMDPMDFNDRIAIDGLTYTAKSGTKYHVYHLIDYATSYHVACPAPNRCSASAIQFIGQQWVSWAGSPVEMIVDAATEFNSREMEEFCQRFNIRKSTICPEAHWQNSRSERHGQILEKMLEKYECEFPIHSYQDLQQAVWFCCQGKNASSLRKGYSPEILVFGKSTRLPGSVSSDTQLPAHMLANSEMAEGLRFREQLAKREAARRAFHAADNDSALRRSLLRRTRPMRPVYSPGSWVMIWRTLQGQGHWIGPLKVSHQEGQHTIWASMSGKLYRSAPENTRHITALETQQYRQEINQDVHSRESDRSDTQHDMNRNEQGQIEIPPISETVGQHPNNQPIPENDPSTSQSTTSEQPDVEPESIPASGLEVPIPPSDDELVSISLISEDVPDENMTVNSNVAWHCEIEITDQDIERWRQEEFPCEMSFLASTSKKQRSEVKIKELTEAQRQEFQKAKMSEVQNWLNTKTVMRLLRDKVSPDQIMKCRWILTWKPLDPEDQKAQDGKTHKAKARLVVLGFMDPSLDTIQRDSPTLNRHSRMLLLQLISSKQWSLKSFDIKAAFLQGQPQKGRLLAIEPVPELKTAMKLHDTEICQLTKSAYGLVDAPYLWYKELQKHLISLGFEESPFDPCVFVLRDAKGNPQGVLGLHVDDGLCGGNEVFEEKVKQLESRFPFGSKKVGQFTFTGIDLNQLHDGSIVLSQSKYVNGIQPIRIPMDRRQSGQEKISEEERHQLRGLVGSLQYASVNTRPDLSSRLSSLQSKINSAVVEDLVEGNRLLYQAKKHHDVCLTIKPISTDDFRFLAFSDASFASPKVPSSHAGSIILGTHKEMANNCTCVISPISWGSRKIQKVVVSTLAAETMALTSTLDHLSWLRLYWGWFLNNKCQWKKPQESLTQLPDSYTAVTYPQEAIAATDCKSLYDLITRTAPPNCQEFRTQLHAKAIKEMVSEGVSLKWVHSGAQLADALTKSMEASFLRETLKSGTYRLHDENAVLKARSHLRTRLKWLREASAGHDHPKTLES